MYRTSEWGSGEKTMNIHINNLSDITLNDLQDIKKFLDETFSCDCIVTITDKDATYEVKT